MRARLVAPTRMISLMPAVARRGWPSRRRNPRTRCWASRTSQLDEFLEAVDRDGLAGMEEPAQDVAPGGLKLGPGALIPLARLVGHRHGAELGALIGRRRIAHH